jgi:IS5 family transposase
MDPHSLFSLNDHLEALSQHGDPLEVLERTVDFEYFREWLVEGLGYGDGSRGGRPPFDPVAMLKALILQAQHDLSYARIEFMIRDRLSWVRFLGFCLGDRTPDENTIRASFHAMENIAPSEPGIKHLGWPLAAKRLRKLNPKTKMASLAFFACSTFCQRPRSR